MIRAAVLVTALLVSTVVSAENWQLVEDGTNGVRLVVDVDSVRLDKYNKDNNTASIAVSAKMSYVESNGDPVTFLTGIDGDDCIYKSGGSIVNIYSDKSQSNYFWSKQGGKLYDAQGQWLCGFLIGYIDEAGKQENRKPANKQSTKPKIKV